MYERPMTHHIDQDTGPADERWLNEWVALGMADLDSYMRKVAAFDRWCAANGR